MAVDTYVVITPYSGSGFGSPLKTESQSSLSLKDLGTGQLINPATLLTVHDYGFDIAQTLNIGSQSSGAGAGKVKLNPFSFTKTIDILSPGLFLACASGTAYAKVDLLLVRSSGTATPLLYAQYTFKLAAVATIFFLDDPVTPSERVTFDYGDLQLRYQQTSASGTAVNGPITAGWNVVKNVADIATGSI